MGLFGSNEKQDFSALLDYAGNALNSLYLFIFSKDGESGYKLKIGDFISGLVNSVASLLQRVNSLEDRFIQFELTSDLQDGDNMLFINVEDYAPKSLIAQVVGANGYIQYAANISFIYGLGGIISSIRIEYDAPIVGIELLNIVIISK